MKMSEFIIKAMWKACNEVINRNQIIIGTNMNVTVDYDEYDCDKILEEMIIIKENVLAYLPRKYIPTWTAHGCMFQGVNCIQQAQIYDKNLKIVIKNSEPHKIITDTLYVMNLMKLKGFEFIPGNMNYRIENLKMISIDLLIYQQILSRRGYRMPEPVNIYLQALLLKYDSLEKIAAIKKKNIKRKFLRYYVSMKRITWSDLRRIMNITDFSEHNIKEIVGSIKLESKLKWGLQNWR